MLRRLTPYLIAAAVALTSTLGLVSRPATGAPAEHVDYVVIAGAAGLRWDDVNPVDTPTMWRLAQHAAVGALSVTSAHSPTCPADGWLTLGAGNFAVRTDPTLSVGPDCPPDTVPVPTQGGTGAMLPDQETGVNRWNRDQSYGAQPGALAEAVRCTVAVGPGAAIAAARASGRVDRYRPALPDQPEPLLASCILSIVDLGTIRGDSPQVRQAAARQADQVLARLLAARPDRSLVIVAGLSDTDRTSRLHVAIADGPGYPAGWLTSSSTSRPGYVKLTDLAPSALTALDRPLPTKLFAGQPAGSIAGRPTDLATAVSRLSDADREAGAQRRVTGWFLTVLTASELLLFAVVTLAVVGVLTATVIIGPWRHGALGPLGTVAGIVATIVGVDVLTGARLQLNGVVGYSALEGGRYAGLGTVGLGLLLASILMVAGWLAQRSRRRWRPVVIAVVGGIGVVLVGSPYLGANAGGAVAVTAGFALLDLLRPPGERGSLGRVLTEAQDGNGAAAIHGTGVANAASVLSSPLTLVVLGTGLLLMLVLLRPWGGLKRLFGLYPAVRATLVGVGVAGLLAGLLDGAGFVVAGAAAATAVPLACLGALRVLDHADDRTPVTGTPVEEPADAAEAADARLAETTSDLPARISKSVRRRIRPGWRRPGRRRPAVAPAAVPGAGVGTVTSGLDGAGPPAVCPPADHAGDVLP